MNEGRRDWLKGNYEISVLMIVYVLWKLTLMVMIIGVRLHLMDAGINGPTYSTVTVTNEFFWFVAETVNPTIVTTGTCDETITLEERTEVDRGKWHEIVGTSWKCIRHQLRGYKHVTKQWYTHTRMHTHCTCTRSHPTRICLPYIILLVHIVIYTHI